MYIYRPLNVPETESYWDLMAGRNTGQDFWLVKTGNGQLHAK